MAPPTTLEAPPGIRHTGAMKAGASMPVLVLAAVLGSASTAAAPAPDSPPLSFADAVARALAANPTLAAARLGLGAARAGVDIAAARPDPDLLLEESRETPHDALSVDLPIETGGKRRRRVELAGAELESAMAAVRALEMETRNQVRRSYYAVVAARERLAVSRQRLELAERALAAARARFEAGDVPRLEVLQTELATAEATSETEDRRAALDAATTSLSTLLGLPPGEPLAVNGELGDGAAPDLTALSDNALAASAELALADRRIAEGEARVALAQAGKTPDLTLSVGVTHGSQPEFDYGWRGALGLNLPISGRHRAEIEAERHRLAQLGAEREALAARIRGEVAAAAALAAAHRRRYERYRDEVLPAAVEIEGLAEESYRAGKTGLVSLLQSLSATGETRQRAIDAGYDYQTALADLELALGAPLTPPP